MKYYILLLGFVGVTFADVSHLTSSGYNYNIPEATVPQQEYLPPSNGYHYDPPQETRQAPVVAPSNQYLASAATAPGPAVQSPSQVFSPPSNEYVPPQQQYVPPAPQNNYIPPSNQYVPPAASEPVPAHTLNDDGYHYRNPTFKF